MRIEDDELRLLFQAECEEHLQSLEEGLLRLEASPDDSATLQAAFRAAHSLKGAARMLGIGDLESVAHESEEVLGNIRRGQAVFSSETVDRLSPVVDAMRAMAQEAVTVEPDDTLESLHERIKAVERRIYIRTISEILERGSVQ